MNQLLKMMRRKSGGSAPPSGLKVIGLNSSESVYFSRSGYYTNLWNAIAPDYHFDSGAAVTWTSVVDGGWNIVALPNTSKIWSFLINNMPGNGTWKPGLYHYLWNGGADATISLDGNIIVPGSVTRVAAGHWTFNTTALDPASNNNYIRVFIENATGAPIAMPGEAIVHDDHLALWQSGVYDRNVNPDYVAWAQQNVGRFRMAKVSGTENSGVDLTTPVSTGLVTESWKFYGFFNYTAGFATGPFNESVTTGMPYSFAAKLCAKLGQAILHASYPVGASDEFIQAIAAQVVSVPQFTGKMLPEPGNENWGGYRGPDGSSTQNWLQTVYLPAFNAPPYSANLINGREAEAHCYMRAYKNCLLGGLPAERVIINYPSQHIFLDYGPIQYTLNTVDVGNVCGRGTTKTFRQILIELNGAYLAAPYNTPAHPDGSMIFNAGYALYDWREMSDPEVKAFFDRGQVALDASVASVMAGIDTYLPGVQRLCYESGHQFNATCNGIAGQNVPFNVSVANSTMVFNAGTASGITRDGDQWAYYQNTSDGYKTPNLLGHDYQVYLRKRLGDSNECYAYTTQAAAIAAYPNDAAAKAAAIAFVDVGNAQPFLGGPVTRIAECGTRVQQWLDSASGRDMYQTFFAHVFGPTKWQQGCQLCDLGYSMNFLPASAAEGKAYGLQESIYSNVTLRCAFWLGCTSYLSAP